MFVDHRKYEEQAFSLSEATVQRRPLGTTLQSMEDGMEKAYAKRWLVLAGAVLVAAPLLATLIAGTALAHGRFGQTSPSGWGHGAMMGGRGYGGWAQASSPSSERHGMMPNHGTYLPRQGGASEGSCPGWAYTPNWRGVECPVVDPSEYGSRDCPGEGEGPIPVRAGCVVESCRSWDCPGCGSEGAPPSDGSDTPPPGFGCGGWGTQRDSGEPHCDFEYGLIPEPDAGGRSVTVVPEGVSFQADVQPILDARCVFCHGNSGGLSLASYSGIMEGGSSGPVLVPGDPSNSRLIRYLESGYMPLRRPPLSPAQIQTLANWIASGVPDN